MMKRIEAISLEEAYSLASKEFNCSITDLEVEVIQNARKGLFGIGKKNAIIIVTNKNSYNAKPSNKPQHRVQKEIVNEKRENTKVEPKPTPITTTPEPIKNEVKENIKTTQTQNTTHNNGNGNNSDIFSNFYGDKKNINDVANEIEKDLEKLFGFGCFELSKIRVTPEDENTLLVEFDGNDAALLIGKEGYRYKALSYMLFNWINPKYNLMVKLEIAEFLKNQEEMIKNYLTPLIENIKDMGYGQTKPLDGVLAHIALKQLRNTFPNKYVVTKENDSGVKYVVVTDFKR